MVADDGAAAAAPWVDLLPWQRELTAAALARRAAWPHALLLAGPRGVGKRILALHFARALLCETPRADGFACGNCASCGYVAAGQHPDLRMVEPFEAQDDGDVKALHLIPVDHVRALTEWAFITSHRGIGKVAVVVPAEELNVAAANALLKTLEEPPPGTYLLLVTAEPARLPATVRSRCQRLLAPPPDATSGEAWLTQQGVGAARSVLAQAAGAPLLALALADPALQAERAEWLEALAKPASLPTVALAARAEAGPKDERKDRLLQVVEWLAAWTADLARVAAGGEPQRNPDFAPALRELARTVAPVALFRYHRALLRQRMLVAHPLQPRLVVESLLFGYRDLFR